MEIIVIPINLIGNITGTKIQTLQNRYNVLITTKRERTNTQIIFIGSRFGYQKIFKIVTYTNCETNNCYYGQECGFLHCKSSVKTVESNHIKKMKHLKNQA